MSRQHEFSMNTKEWLDEVSKSSLCSRVTLDATYDAAISLILNDIPGDFVECGVWAGANCAAMARAIQDFSVLNMARKMDADGASMYPPLANVNRRVHLFDSFEGIPQAGPHDAEYLNAGHQGGLSKCSMEVTKQQMKAWGIPDELLEYRPGWFKDTIPQAWEFLGCTGIALLRLDGDLYESTKESLELYPLVSVGGKVIVDDWTLSGVRRAMQEYFGAPGAPGPIQFQKETA